MENGRHKREDIPFPDWVPEDVQYLARSLTADQAEGAVSKWMERYGIS
jgi:hypothetical protein